MAFLLNAYQKTLEQNEIQQRFWIEHLNSLKSLDLTAYSDKLKVEALIPVGSRIFFRGELIHTNELTIALGSNYFVKCGLQQAEIIREHRIKGAESNLEALQKERNYLMNHLSFSQNVLSPSKDIIEVHSEDEDKLWREKHKENVKKSKQKKTDLLEQNDIRDEELWSRLEELELQEELKNELEAIDDSDTDEGYASSRVQDSLNIVSRLTTCMDSSKETNIEEASENNETEMYDEEILSQQVTLNDVFRKQRQLEEKIEILSKSNTFPVQTEDDLLKRLDELENQEAVEDDVYRLESLIEQKVVSSEDESEASEKNKSVCFAIDNDYETIDIEFTHSVIIPEIDAYDSKKGIRNPSHIYDAFHNLFQPRVDTISILKKNSSYKDSPVPEVTAVKKSRFQLIPCTLDDIPGAAIPQKNDTIVIPDITDNQTHIAPDDNTKRPQSLFKQRRQQQLAKKT